jgi:anaerobic magnesium-protoporphyrin IX monomethyl ester cyclase
MKVLLIKPPLTLQKDFKGIGRFFPPIGLGYLASSLEKAGHEVKILDASIEKWNKVNDRGDGVKYLGMSWDDITDRVREEKPDMVGISILTVEAVNAFLTAKAVKKASRNIIVVAGGPHVCVRPEETISDSNVDFITIGEGEQTIVELSDAIENKNSLKGVKGIWHKQSGKIVRNEARPLMTNLDDLPFPSWHLMNLDKYFKAAKYLQGSRSMDKRSLSVISSRGCPFSCVFCTIRLSMGQGFRPRSPKNVVDEIEALVDTYGIEHIGFEDDNLTFDKQRMEDICDLLIVRELNEKITWGTPNGVRADRLDEKLLRKMKQSGCREIIVAPESGSQYVVDNIIGKKLKLSTVENVVRLCRKIGIECGCFFVIGMPGETKKQIEETFAFANRMRSMGATPFCSIAWPYYGSRLYNEARKKGYLLKKDGKDLEFGLLNMEAMIRTPEFTPEELYEYQRRIQGETESGEIFGLIRTRPMDALRCFSLHPGFITKYIVKNYLLRSKK